MPFKTKKKKIKASAKKFFISDQGLAVYVSENTQTSKVKKTSRTISEKNQPISSAKYFFVTREVVKIVTLASIIIGLQVFLYLSNISF